MNFEF